MQPCNPRNPDNRIVAKIAKKYFVSNDFSPCLRLWEKIGGKVTRNLAFLIWSPTSQIPIISTSRKKNIEPLILIEKES